MLAAEPEEESDDRQLVHSGLLAFSPPRFHHPCGCIERRREADSFTDLRTQGPVDTLPPIPSFPGLFVLLRGGLLFPGLPVALGAIRSSNSSTSSRISSFIVFHLHSLLGSRQKNRDTDR